MSHALCLLAEIVQLIVETKALQKMGFHLPEPAHMVMLQEQRFKKHFDDLTYMLNVYAELISSVPRGLEAAMEPMLKDVEQKLVRNLCSVGHHWFSRHLLL
jgi:hypothetical protein